jgi:hypothetical protein
MTTPYASTSNLSTQQQTEVNEQVSLWLELLARFPFVTVHPEQRDWIIRHALAQPSVVAAHAFVNDAMWRLRFGDALTPVPESAEEEPTGLDEVDRETLGEEAEQEFARLEARGVIIHPSDRKKFLDEAAAEPDLDAARLLLTMRLATEEERQEGELWNLIDHYVDELAELNFFVPKDAQFAILRRALSLPDLDKSEGYLHAVFKRLRERAMTKQAELELHLRRGLALRRATSAGMGDEEFDNWELQKDLEASIKQMRYRSSGASDTDIDAHMLQEIEDSRATLTYLVEAYQAEVTAMFDLVEMLLNHSDYIVAKRAAYALPDAVKALRKRWEFITGGVEGDQLMMINKRIWS